MMWTVQFRNFSIGIFGSENEARTWARVNLRSKNYEVTALA